MFRLRFRPRFVIGSLVASLLIAVLILAACSAAAPTGAPNTSRGAAPMPPQAQPTSAPAAAPTAAASGAGKSAPSSAAAAVPAIDRKIIKNAQLTMTVENTGTAIQRVTAIAGDVGGYVSSTHTFAEGNSTGAQLVVSVPVDRFEEALNLVRKVAMNITSDTTSSSDVSDQYVDLQSRLKNLQATADRIRQFLDKAATVDEALKVNQQLSDVEAEIEQIKGQLNVLDARTSYSTITADIHEPRPTPTPTSTSTPTPTPTPVGWNPGQTFGDAVRVQTSLLTLLGDLIIWLVVVLLPYLILMALVAGAVIWFFRRFARPPAPPGANGAGKQSGA